MIKNLKDITLEEKFIFGPKAYNLGHLIRSGYDVPPGFALSPDTIIDGNTRPELKKVFHFLKNNVAVRSSMASEDSKKQSYAGQFDTYLDINSEDGLFDAIKSCRDSTYNHRAIAYMKTNSITNPRMGIIIHQMLNPDYSGIIFTLDPIERKDMIVELVTGKGDKLASGIVTPESVSINRDSLVISDMPLHTFLNDSILKQIAMTAMGIEKLFGFPQDIEFCIVGSKIWIVQSRPITTL